MTNRDSDDIDKVVDAVEAGEEIERESVNGRALVELSTGVKLKIRPVPRHFMYEVTRRFVRPKPPMVDIGKGRLEENPGNPDYADALERFLADTANAATDVALLRGTEIDFVPDDVPGPDSKTFREEMELLGLSMLDSSRARYLYWVKYMAAPTSEDINGLLGELGRLTGVAESDVEDAVARFRSVTVRGEDRSAIDE
jgi:hypothetical protein